MTFPKDQEQIIAALGLRIRRQQSGSLLDVLFVEMDVDKREAHGQHEVWRRKQKDAETPNKRAIDIRSFERHIVKKGITNWKNYERSEDDACRDAQPCRERN